MEYTKEICDKAKVRGYMEYLLYGVAYEQEEKSYEERLKDVYQGFDTLAEKWCTDSEGVTQLQEYASELVREASEVYMELGIKAGVMLMLDIMQQDSSIPKGRCTPCNTKKEPPFLYEKGVEVQK